VLISSVLQILDRRMVQRAPSPGAKSVESFESLLRQPPEAAGKHQRAQSPVAEDARPAIPAYDLATPLQPTRDFRDFLDAVDRISQDGRRPLVDVFE
jgi:hypothetical protein